MNRIDVLPDDILLEIFDFCVGSTSSWLEGKWRVEKWQLLVHVCRRWRSLVLASPRRLNLRLFCTHTTPAKDTLDVWPALPLMVSDTRTTRAFTDIDHTIAALGQSNRVCQVNLYLTDLDLERVLAAMQVPFPELTGLSLTSYDETVPVIPDSFLDGSAPRLREFELGGIPFPGLPNLLLSATHLVSLTLSNIPHSAYISPEAIVALISMLSSLETLIIKFRSPQSRPDQETRRPPSSKRSVIPTLRSLEFKGVIEYSEDLVARIDTPQLDNLSITFFNQIDFDIPQLAQFINRTPKLWKPDAHVQFDEYYAHLGLPPAPESRTLEIAIKCKESDWKLSAIEQICNSSLHTLSTAEDLYIERPFRYPELVWKGDAIENTLWLQLLLPFTAVKNLYLSKEFAPGIAAALQELVGGRIMEVLPSLQNIFVEALELSGPFQKNIEQFVAARQLSDHPIAISVWSRHIDADWY